MSDQGITKMPKVCERWLDSCREVCGGKIRFTERAHTSGLYLCDRCGVSYGPSVAAPEGVSGPEQGAAGGTYPDDLETAILILEEWAVERFPDEGRFVSNRKDCAWTVTQALRAALRSAPPDDTTLDSPNAGMGRHSAPGPRVNDPRHPRG